MAVRDANNEAHRTHLYVFPGPCSNSVENYLIDVQKTAKDRRIIIRDLLLVL